MRRSTTFYILPAALGGLIGLFYFMLSNLLAEVKGGGSWAAVPAAAAGPKKAQPGRRKAPAQEPPRQYYDMS